MPSYGIALISPMEMAMVLHLDRLESPLPMQRCFVPSLIKIGPVVLEKMMKIRKDGQTDRQ